MTTELSKSLINDSIRKMTIIIKKCNESITQYGETGHVFTGQIQEYYPFQQNPKREVPYRAEPLKIRLEQQIKVLEGRLHGL